MGWYQRRVHGAFNSTPLSHMSDITCEYTITGRDQTGYFLLPRNTTFGQLGDFIRENIFADNFILKNYRREEITSSEQLDQLLNLSNEFVFPLWIEPVAAEEPVPEAESGYQVVEEEFEPESGYEVVGEEFVPADEEASKPFLGPICTRILSYFGVEVEIEEGFDPLVLIRQLPCFIAPMVEQRYQEILANPERMESSMRFVADMTGESYEELLSEVKNTAAQLRQSHGNAEQPQEQPQEEVHEEPVRE